jgi:murein L,D-transpeptidase YcbB/YkuD
VARLRARLAASGDLEVDAPQAADPFDAALDRAVRRFQIRHGLAPDGRVGPETLAALDISPARRAEQLAANLAARRRLESALSPRFVLVNVPDYRLLVVEGRATTLAMAVAVGRPDWSTPPIDDSIERIVVHPAWNVPASIVAAELAPRAARDPGYWKRNDMRLAGGGVRQEPGPRNPLGRLEFVFPNREDVYLHDTPAQGVFDRRERSVSHGCLRLDDAPALAEHLLRDVPGWDRARLAAAIASGRTQTIALPSPVPIHVVYWTAWVDDEGELQLRKDVYAAAVDPDTAPVRDAAHEAPGAEPPSS